MRRITGSALPLAMAAALLHGGAAQAATSDPLRDLQWGLDQVRAEQAWTSTTGAGAVVAVVDSGVDFSHPDLRANLVQGATFTGCENQSPCGNGDFRGPDGENNGDEHGTHVAGIVAAVTDNGIGVAGTAPDATILPVKVLEDGSGSFEEIADGIRWSADNGADVINLSLGALPGVQALTLTGQESSVTEAIAYANDRGVSVIAAAGNSATALCNTPAFEPGAVCVASTDRNEAKSWFSELPNKADLKAVSAPGGAGLLFCEDDIVSTVPLGTGSAACGEEDYDFYAGTSMATPHVAGVAALLFAQGRDREEVERVLLDTARQPLTDITGVYSPVFGWGIVDAAAATATPVATAPAPTTGKGGKGGGKPRR
ncbi:hypothetical protein GCM10011376_03930 [Nocardioides flavus (ex Wang et al. 2016)]|uniref:Peptidase S8/S53 domain-containing protein n=1 Tax=Nocardioides flavus (ex Wang et al. 2016) TaxID=2058780 RepID=A0ABQ3HFY8_9ACTN|nr:S8 family peptidase [Nocardioides flavus (ex Wang et al. 2016)]GHE15495.1 hypothetical protein GCM10011376_03930 [Nocardioides flavus (ex Wang et al. 2016)]